MTTTQERPDTASVAETIRIGFGVALPTLAGGVIKRRPRAMAVAEKLQVDRPAVKMLTRLRDRHGGRPLKLRVPGRSVELALSAEDVGAVLAAAPTPFSPSTVEKRAALGHFQPHGVLISPAGERGPRRAFSEAVLEPGRPLHELAAPFARAIAEETAALTTAGELTWDSFNVVWWRLVRRIVLGEGARDDETLTDQLERLRLDANWAYLHPRRNRLRAEFHDRLTAHLERAEPGSLAAAIAATPGDGTAADQVAHWLFAFDAAGMVTLRTLALLASHPAAADRAREEIAGTDPGEPHQLSYLRACVLDAIRLWPTTPMLLRESTEETSWGPAGTTVLVFTPFFHRDADLPYADRFDPDIWLDGRAAANPALVPFSAGPAICPGRDLVQFCVSTLLANLLRSHAFEQTTGPVLAPDRPLPATLDNFHLKFAVRPVLPREGGGTG
ncbi:cytochrome P450 [Amycolatopsis sp. SID8362]|uniref:cytochrome P450 n=1 Tax=Amycolatopsis sp. SID8362 TaxID=2690346 RepID=UPI0013706EAD|nr:cytochrome P450 [Amycolatopsis sp. SID8362]NBH05859.1 cytochrome P450 [Amycolatopsis sp. SID8362]NED42557.1 cytochrome P450 [Amycolatopsis sp. SID8362]